MRFLSVLIALTTLSLTLAAQKRYAGKKAQLSYLKSDGSPASEKEAQLMVAITKVNDTAWRKDQYLANGPIQSSQYFKTKELELAHGPAVAYHRNGLAESFGPYLEGKQHGDWYFVNDIRGADGGKWIIPGHQNRGRAKRDHSQKPGG